MSLTSFLTWLGYPIAYYPRLAEVLGGVNPAVLACQLLYWQTTPRAGGGAPPAREEAAGREIYKTADDIQRETGLSEEEQRTARRKLKSRGVLCERYDRLNHRMYFRVDFDALDRLVGEDFPKSGIPTSGNRESQGGEVGNTSLAKSASQTSNSTEITSQITSKKTTTPTGGELVWPVQLAPRARQACERELRRCPPDRRVDIVRELSHRLIRAPHDPLRLPHLWVRALARAASAGTLVKIAPAALLDAGQRDAIEREYQRRLQASRERGAIALARLTPQR